MVKCGRGCRILREEDFSRWSLSNIDRTMSVLLSIMSLLLGKCFTSVHSVQLLSRVRFFATP